MPCRIFIIADVVVAAECSSIKNVCMYVVVVVVVFLKVLNK